MWSVMNEERTGTCLWQVGHIRSYLWHICSENFRRDDFNLTNRNVSVLLRITDSDYPFVFRLILLLERKIVIIVICVFIIVSFAVNKGNNKITELRTILQRESQNSKCLYQVRVITVFTVFRLLTDFVCLYNYECWLSLCKIVRSSVILLLPLFL
jgi:hypothetical protein